MASVRSRRFPIRTPILERTLSHRDCGSKLKTLAVAFPGGSPTHSEKRPGYPNPTAACFSALLEREPPRKGLPGGGMRELLWHSLRPGGPPRQGAAVVPGAPRIHGSPDQRAERRPAPSADRVFRRGALVLQQPPEQKRAQLV